MNRVGFRAPLTTTVVKKEGATISDIRKAVIEVHQECLHQTKRYAKDFDFSTERGFEELWSKVKYGILYQPDEPGHEIVKSPNALRVMKVGDCKSFTILIGTTLINAGIPVEYHLVDYGDKNAAHIYPVAYLEGEPIIMDAVYKAFNQKQRGEKRKQIYNPETGRLIKRKTVGAIATNQLIPNVLKIAGGYQLTRQKNILLQGIGLGLMIWGGKNLIQQ